MYIELKNVCKYINSVPILNNISYCFESGNIYGFQGKNGCGKTMLMRAICGLININSGTIDINGQILHQDISFPPSIGILIENPAFLNNFTGFQNLRILANIQGDINDAEIKKTLQSVGLNPYDKRIYKKYSLGMKQKLGIASAIMGTPKIIILDEPLNAIDENGVENIKKLLNDLRTKDIIIIIACHDRIELEQISNIMIPIENGRIITND